MSVLIRSFAAHVTSRIPAARVRLALVSSAALAGAALPAVGLMASPASAATQSCMTTAAAVTCDASSGGTPEATPQEVTALSTRMRAWLVVHTNGTYTLYARLTTSGSGILGQPIGFTADRTGPGLCKAATDANGVASCHLDASDTWMLLRYRGAFTARYGGTPNWQAASAYYPGIMWF